MKAYKLALLSLALVLPAQELLADSSAKAKSPTVTERAALNVTNPLRNKTEDAVNASTRGDLQRVRQPNIRQRANHPNLVVVYFGWEHANCEVESPHVARDLHIAKTACKVKLLVKNASNVALSDDDSSALRSRNKAQLTYTMHDGRIMKRGVVVGSIGANQVKDVYIQGRIGYYKTDQPFSIKLDHLARFAETNENDNTASFSPRL